MSTVITPLTTEQKAWSALGTPLVKSDASGSVSRAVSDKVISLGELQRVWGITPEQLQGLGSYGVVWQDGINEVELDELLAYKGQMLENFISLLTGSGKSRQELEQLFEKIYALALRGELDNGSWDDVMDAAGLDDYEMTGSAFRALLGGNPGFSDDARVESLAELGRALRSLLLTMKMNSPEKGQESEKNYALVLKRYCAARNFHVIDLGDFQGAVDQVLMRINKEDVSRLSRSELLDKIRDGDYGETLQKLAGLAGNWDEYLAVLLAKMENAVEKNTDSNKIDATQFYLTRSKRMRGISDILNDGPNGDPKRWPALLGELTKVYKGDKTDFDYLKVMDGEVKEDK